MCASASAKGCTHSTANTHTRYQGSGFTHHSHATATRDNFRHGHAATVQVVLTHNPFTSLLPHPRPTPTSHASHDALPTACSHIPDPPQFPTLPTMLQLHYRPSHQLAPPSPTHPSFPRFPRCYNYITDPPMMLPTMPQRHEQHMLAAQCHDYINNKCWPIC